MEGCHFDLRNEYDENDKYGRSVVIRNIPSEYAVSKYEHVGIPIKKIRQPKLASGLLFIVLPALKIATETKEDAIKLEETMNEMEVKGRELSVKRIREQ